MLIENMKINFVEYNRNTNHKAPQLNIIESTEEKSKNLNQDNKCKVSLINKIILEPSQQTYIKVKTQQEMSNLILFKPNIKNEKITCYNSIHNFEDKAKKSFEIFIQNNSEEPIHFNKNTIIGSIEKIEQEQIQDYNFENTENEFSNNENTEKEYINLITPSQDIIRQRKIDLTAEDFNLEHLNHTQKNEIMKLLLDNSQAFSKSVKTLGHSDLITPKISFLHNHPIRTLPFPLPQSLQDQTFKQLQELQEAGIIKREVTEWACPMLLVKKKVEPNKEQQYRLALDLRLINSIIRYSAYPLPKISTIISNISSYKIFTTCDLPNAYWQLDLPEQYQEKLAFTSQWGTFKFLRLMFGMRTSASIFQALMDQIIHEANKEGLFAYQDDLIIGAHSYKEMKEKLQVILNLFTKYNLTLSPAKCKFFTNEINYLGFRINNHKVFPIEANIIKINAFPRPKTKRQVKSFIGLCSFYRTLIPCFSDLMQPLIALTSPKVPFVWEQVHDDAFKQLQDIFFKKPFLQLPNFNKEFILNSDASLHGISAVLLQDYNGQLMPISYFSKSLTPAEKKFPPIKLELFAIFKGINAFKYYLYNRHFIVLSDSKPLETYRKTSCPTDVVTRWLLDISEYSFTFKHIAGVKNILADFLSRLEENPPCQDLTSDENLLNSNEALPVIDNHSINHITHHEAEDPPLEISNNTFHKEQLNDKKLKLIREEILNRKNTDKHPHMYIDSTTDLLMFFKEDENDSSKPKIVVPSVLVPKVLKIAHTTHTGMIKTYQELQKAFYWRGMYVDMQNFVSSCDKCIIYKHHPVIKAPLLPTPLPTAPGQQVKTDILGPFKNGQYVLTFIDVFSRHMQLFPLQSITAEAVTERLITYVSLYGKPISIHSDQGKQFIAQVFNLFTKAIGVKLTHSVVAHPESNSHAERINQKIKSSVATLLAENVSFKNALRIHQCHYNASVHSSCGFSPFFLHFSREIPNFYDNIQNCTDKVTLDNGHYILKVLKDMQKAHEQAFELSKEKQQKQNQKYASRKLRKFVAGDQVFIRPINKFEHYLSGPFTIIKKFSNVIYLIRLSSSPTAKPFKIHLNRLVAAPPRKAHLQLQPSSYEGSKSSPHQPVRSHHYNLRGR